MHKEVVELLEKLTPVYKSILERNIDTSEIEESDILFLNVYKKYVFGESEINTKKQ